MAQVKTADHINPSPGQTEQTVPALEISNLSFSYHNREAEAPRENNGDIRNQVLGNVSYTVPQGALLAVLGPNGGGKTTLLRLILGFLKPDSGTLEIFGQVPGKMRDHLGYVPQFTTARLDFPATVEEVVLMGSARSERGPARWRGCLGSLARLPKLGNYWGTGARDRKKARNLLERLGLANYSRRLMSELSGGERQRALIARALMGWTEDEPFLLLLDEPTSSVDPAGKFCFYDFLHSLRGQITSILVSHDLTMASSIFSHLVVINHNLVEAQPISQGKNTEENRFSLGFSAASDLAPILGRHEHECQCPVSAFIKAATGSSPVLSTMNFNGLRLK